MGGAFVGVADDATAGYWNPAGLVGGPAAGMTVGWVDFGTGDRRGPAAAGQSGTWPVGLSYGRYQDTEIISAPDGTLRVEGLAVSQLGATVLQSIAQGLVVGSTIKHVRGRAISAPIEGLTGGDALERAARAEGDSSSHLDLDLGAMADMGRVRLGVTMRNLREPSFTDMAGSAIKLQRQTRMGLAVLPANGLTLAVDVDLDTVDLRDGPRRMLAVGGEDRFGHRWALRGGMRWDLEGVRRPVGTVGASLAFGRSLWLDGHYTYGRLDADRGFGVALRAGS